MSNFECSISNLVVYNSKMKKKLNNVKNSTKSHHADQADQSDFLDMDETSYLLSNEVNKKRLLDSIEEMNQGIYLNNKLIE
jgi:hypothetical protein